MLVISSNLPSFLDISSSAYSWFHSYTALLEVNLIFFPLSIIGLTHILLCWKAIWYLLHSLVSGSLIDGFVESKFDISFTLYSRTHSYTALLKGNLISTPLSILGLTHIQLCRKAIFKQVLLLLIYITMHDWHGIHVLYLTKTTILIWYQGDLKH